MLELEFVGVLVDTILGWLMAVVSVDTLLLGGMLMTAPDEFVGFDSGWM